MLEAIKGIAQWLLYAVVFYGSIWLVIAVISAVYNYFYPPRAYYNPYEGCTKICYEGKACGNTCINRNYDCYKPKGTACDL